jgi:hypothetical protein
VATAQPAGATEPAHITHCYASPHHTAVHWNYDVIERKYGHSAHVSHVTFWWDIPSRGGRVNGTATLDGDHAGAITLAGATTVHATVDFSSGGQKVGSFNTGTAVCTEK